MTRPFSRARLRRSPSFPRLTGVQVEIFDQMLKQLQVPWDKAQGRKAKPGRPWEVGGLEEHLLIMLLYYRCYVTQEFIGCFFGVDKSVICRTIQRIEVLAKPLFGLKREPRISEEEAIAIIVDCTEQPIYRPRAYASPHFRLNPSRNKRIQPATVAFHKESGPAGPDS